MKIFTPLLLSGFILTMASCDYVNKPTSGAPQTAATTNTVPAVPRKVLLEDYTGHTCGNCPKAAIQAANVEGLYNTNVIVLAIHAGFFATPEASPSPYTNDFRNPTGDAWDAFFGIGAAGNPNGMINRVDFSTGNHIKSYTNWTTQVAPFINQAADAKLTITRSYNASTKSLDVTVKTKFLNALASNYKLSVVLMEDSITAAQKDYTQNPDEVPAYIFRHMLRGGINGIWGDALNTTPVAANDSIVKSYNAFAIDPTYNDTRLHVIAFIYNATTYEVIQAEEVKVR